MSNIEEDIELLKSLDTTGDKEFTQAIKNILSERDQDEKRIKELEEQVKILDEAYAGAIKESKKWFDIAHNRIPKQKIKDLLTEIQEEYNKVQEQFDCIWNKKSKDDYERYKL